MKDRSVMNTLNADIVFGQRTLATSVWKNEAGAASPKKRRHGLNADANRLRNLFSKSAETPARDEDAKAADLAHPNADRVASSDPVSVRYGSRRAKRLSLFTVSTKTA